MEFPAETNMHFRGRESLDKPGVLVFPKVLVCLDCGLAQFTVPDTALGALR